MTDNNVDFERILELISKYEQIKKSGEIKRYNEESTKKDFIQPLFESLGWNFSNRGKSNDSVSAEETISKKRVDYGFRISGIPKFFLEAKSLKEENIQTNHKYITQAIDYAWMKSCSWAILTNFETIAVYNADWKESNYRNNLFFVLHPSDFLTDKRFTYLSKGALENNVLDNEASKYGKKQLKNPINKQLLQDMIHFREVLSKDIVRNNQDKHLNQDDIDESVQRILDRLIFIRNAEDRGLEENQLQSNVRQWRNKGKGHLVKEISGIYKDYDDKYNSKLFAHHLCDDLYIENEALQEVIEGLNQSKDNSYRYDFSIIESDVLGNIYEQYLGNILKSTPKRAKLEESKTHRKEQGIYYTPSYIVDYIVKNTVGEFIKTHTPEEIRNVKILDPACGSGSFLIRAYKELENYWKQNSNFAQLTLDSEEFYSKRVEILKNNIFGVDLDPKAVEIAQLNLLLQISEKKQRLPLLQNNIKVGNSLIDDPSISDRAFKWEGEFPEIMKDGGFNIVIGNPPYIRIQEIDEKEKYFLSKKTKISEGYFDTYMLFTEFAINHLNERGLFSFIIPLKFITANYGQGLRQFLLNSGSIEKIVDFGDLPVFETATTYSGIIVFKKSSTKSNIEVYKETDLNLVKNGLLESYDPLMIPQSSLTDGVWSLNDLKEIDLISKLKRIDTKLSDICVKIFQGLITSADSVFILLKKGEKYFSYSMNQYVDLEPELIRNIVKGLEVKKYAILSSDRVLLFPYYKNGNGKYNLIPEEILKNRYPKTFHYLESNQEILNKRKDVKNGSIKWYALSRPQNLEEFEKIKLMTPFNAFSNSFTVDFEGKWFFTAGVAGGYGLKLKDQTNIKYILGLLNSKLSEFYVRSTSTYLRGKYYSYEHRFIKNIPIIFGKSEATKNVEEIVSEIINLNKLLTSISENTDDYNEIKEEIIKKEKQIDSIVYKIYNLTNKEIAIIEKISS